MKNLVVIYNEIGPDLSLFLYLYKQIKNEGLNKQEITELIQNQRKIIDMKNAIDLLHNHINYLRREEEELREHIKNYLEDIKRISS